MHGETVDVKIGGFRVNLSAVDRRSVGDAAQPFQFGQVLEDIGVLDEESIQFLRSVRKICHHFTGWCPCVEFNEHLLNHAQHHVLIECLLKCGGIDHGALEARHQPVVFRELLEFTAHIFWNHQEHPLGLSVVEKNLMEAVATDDVEVGLEHQIHSLVDLFHKCIHENVRVDQHQRREVEVVQKATL